MRNYPRRLDARRTLLDPEITVEYAFESFDSEESSALGFATEAPTVSPVAPPASNSSAVVADIAVPTRLAAAGVPSESILEFSRSGDWAPLVATPTRQVASEHRSAVGWQQESVASFPVGPTAAEVSTSKVEVFSALALVGAWLVALSMAGFAFLSEGPQLMPTVRSAFSRPKAPPPPIVQTHRTEDVHLPSPKGTKPRTAR